MITKNKTSELLFYLSLLAFAAFSIYILYINQEVFYAAHDRSEFLYGETFFRTMMSRPLGLTQYVGAWLTQLFYYPALGTGVLVAIWAAIFFVGAKAFRLKGAAISLMLIPVACLLTSVVDLGYWIYIMTIRGYWFSQSVGYLIILMLLWVARCTPRKWHFGWYILGICLYPILGWFALLFVLCLALVEKPTWRELLAIFFLFVTANMWHAWLYSRLPLEPVTLAGLPRFETPSDSSPYLSAPFWILGAASILFILLGRYLAKWYVPVICVIAGIVFTSTMMYHDKNYINEMRMVRYAEDDNWQEVLNIAAESSSPTVSMVMLKNVALNYEGGLLSRSFKMGNDSKPFYNPDSIHVSFLEIASPIVYYNYGLINEGFRLAFECAEQAGFSPFYLKMLARCAKANGEEKLVERYTSMLQKLPFYADWQAAPVSEKIQELHKSYPDELTGVENSASYLMTSISLWHETDSKVASELSLFYNMMRCDSKRFWLSIRKYVKLHMDEEFPLHAQEAYILFMDKAPEEKRIMIPVNEDIYARYKQFWETITNKLKSGQALKTAGEEMRSEWHDTYWWYFIFGR